MNAPPNIRKFDLTAAKINDYAGFQFSVEK